MSFVPHAMAPKIPYITGVYHPIGAAIFAQANLSSRSARERGGVGGGEESERERLRLRREQDSRGRKQQVTASDMNVIEKMFANRKD